MRPNERSLDDLARTTNREHFTTEAVVAELIERELRDGAAPGDVPDAVVIELALQFLESACPGLLDDLEETVRHVQERMQRQP